MASISIDRDWAEEKMQPFAISQFYNTVWPGVKIIEVDKEKRDSLATVIDIGGADKMLQFRDGGIAFLAQRFRRYKQICYDDFTLRRDRPSGIKTEFGKLKSALERCGFIAGYYAYGHANKREDGFVRMRILKLRELTEAILAGQFQLQVHCNTDGSSTFYAIPFKAIPPRFFIIDYATDKLQRKLEL